ncbi:phospho-sugar glycosidase domain-containing protein [Gottfriedia sp. NPDC057991]
MFVYGRYKCELHLILKYMPNDGRKNIVGRIPENEVKL